MKRKLSGGALGLGGYASDEDEEEATEGSIPEGEEQIAGLAAGKNAAPSTGILLTHYRSRESLDNASDGGEGEELGAEEGGPSPQPATSGDSEASEPPEPQPRPGVAPADTAADDPLALLPPELRGPLPTECPPQLQAKFAQYHTALRVRGICLTDQVMHRKAFRNPDFLQNLVEHFNVQEHGSAFPPEVFDPAGLPAEDTIDQLLKALEREQDRRAKLRVEQQAAGSARIDFSRGAGPLGHIPASGSHGNLAAVQAAQAVQAAAQQAQAQAAVFAQVAAARVAAGVRPR